MCLSYTQIPGVDFTDNFSTVVYDIILKIVLTLWIIYGLDIDQIDIETAFQERDLSNNEYIYLKCPEGIDLAGDECLEVRKDMYGMVQAARVY